MWSIPSPSTAAVDEIQVGTLISGQARRPQGIESPIIIAGWETAWRMTVSIWCIRKDATGEVLAGNTDSFHLRGQQPCWTADNGGYLWLSDSTLLNRTCWGGHSTHTLLYVHRKAPSWFICRLNRSVLLTYLQGRNFLTKPAVDTRSLTSSRGSAYEDLNQTSESCCTSGSDDGDRFTKICQACMFKLQ